MKIRYVLSCNVLVLYIFFDAIYHPNIFRRIIGPENDDVRRVWLAAGYVLYWILGAIVLWFASRKAAREREEAAKT